MFEFLDYGVLRLIWWALLGILLLGFAVLDGMDLGLAMILPFAAKTDKERRIMINVIGPTWENSQVWLLLGGGAIFAAWPIVYAVSFSQFYLALILLLFALILRPVAFKFRSKIDKKGWRLTWDWVFCVGAFIPSLIFGVGVGNSLTGVPFSLDNFLRPVYTNGFIVKHLGELLAPFCLLTGLVSVAMMITIGASYTALRTNDPMNSRAINISKTASLITLVLYILGGIGSLFVKGYDIVGEIDMNGPSNPHLTEVVRGETNLFSNFLNYPILLIIPLITILSLFLVNFFMKRRKVVSGFISNIFSVAFIVITAGASGFPFILPSYIDVGSSLTVFNSSSSQLTLLIMLITVLIFFPIMIVYTSWVYKVLSGKVTEQDLEDNDQAY